ncbi:MAG: TlpA family protein disulfide reductase [Verrucomicrobia bacterium]|nr:TlpA family protein disulfide reductase [Verrucomicrobiota bacterium]
MRELPHLKEVVNRYKDQGLEIVGISLDSEKTKEKLGQVVTREQMFWPQYFDGKGWKNELAVRFHINSIPAVWLVDRDGIVRDTVANLDLEARVQQWLKPAVAAR